MRRFLITLAAVLITVSVNAQKKWTLKDCIDYAMQNNIDLQQARLSKQSRPPCYPLSPPRPTRVWAIALGRKVQRVEVVSARPIITAPTG